MTDPISGCRDLAEAEEHFGDREFYDEIAHGYVQQLRTAFDRYVRPSDEVAEFGVHKCGTTVLLLQRCKHLYSWEIGQKRKPRHDAVMALAGDRWTLTYENSRLFSLPVDVLFIDSDHVYDCMKAELWHAPLVRRYIILHDTTTHWWIGHGGAKGIGPAVREFLRDNTRWREVERFWPAPGIMVLGRLW